MYTPAPYLWKPQLRAVTQTIDSLLQGRDVCLQGPTGSGKTTVALELMRWANAYKQRAVFYVNRKLLVQQTLDRFQGGGLDVAVRSADYDDCYDEYCMSQIASANTEMARVYCDNPVWKPFPADLVIVDEAHIQKGSSMQKILADHKSRGAKVVLLSATPVGLSNMADELIVSGTLAEYRACKAIVPAVVKSIEQPDMAKVKRSVTGEYQMNGRTRKIYTQHIVGNVIESWKRFNPNARPAMLYAPGKAESLFLTQQFEAIGVRWCHVDATDAYLDGKRYGLSRNLWQDLQGQFKDGKIKGISSRFKLREGVDVPSTYHLILATPIGSLPSYLQTCGRGLRYSPETPDKVLITDHGGNYLRHGSPNHDRDWHVLWKMNERQASELHEIGIREGKTPEPIRCPNCMGERTSGSKCPHCGHVHAKSVREVRMENGRLKTVEGGMIRQRKTKLLPDTQRLWDKLYWGARRNKTPRTFRQLEAWFRRKHGYWPPRTLNNMPQETLLWARRVKDVPMSDLRTQPKGGVA